MKEGHTQPVFMWLHLLGVMASCIEVIPWARLQRRPPQLFFLSQWKPSSRDLSATITITPFIRDHLAWWSDSANLLKGSPLRQPSAELVLRTDASTSWGWGGAIVRGPFAQGRWTTEEAKRHINFLELMAVWRCLSALQDTVMNRVILLQTDNTSVVHYINKQGGTKSPQLCYLAWEVLHWCRQKGITLKAAHLAGSSNSLADLLSRKRISPIEWSLNKGVVEHIFSKLGRPLIDLFASDSNFQLPTYCSWSPSESAWAIDARSVSWRGLDCYAYPPISLIPRILEKLEEEGARLLLIAPNWPRRPWFPRILSLLRAPPVLLSPREDLLSQHRGQIFHPDPQQLALAAWPLSSVRCEALAFLDKRRSSWRPPYGIQRGRSTNAASESLLAGVVHGISIHFERL